MSRDCHVFLRPNVAVSTWLPKPFATVMSPLSYSCSLPRPCRKLRHAPLQRAVERALDASHKRLSTVAHSRVVAYMACTLPCAPILGARCCCSSGAARIFHSPVLDCTLMWSMPCTLKTCAWEGDRLVVAAYCAKQVEQLSAGELRRLLSFHFHTALTHAGDEMVANCVAHPCVVQRAFV